MFIFTFVPLFLVCFLGFFSEHGVVSAESQNIWGWKGLLQITLSNLPDQGCLPREGCTGSGTGRFWIFPENEETTASLGSLLQFSVTFTVKLFFFISKWKFLCISFPHCPLPFLWRKIEIEIEMLYWLLAWIVNQDKPLIFTKANKKTIQNPPNKQLKSPKPNQSRLWITLWQSTRT